MKELYILAAGTFLICTAFLAGVYCGHNNATAMEETHFRLERLRAGCVKQYYDKEGYIRYSGCKI